MQEENTESNCDLRYHLGKGIVEDLKQRIPYYLSDFFDGFVGEKTLQVDLIKGDLVSLFLSLLLCKSLSLSLIISLTCLTTVLERKLFRSVCLSISTDDVLLSLLFLVLLLLAPLGALSRRSHRDSHPIPSHPIRPPSVHL